MEQRETNIIMGRASACALFRVFGLGRQNQTKMKHWTFLRSTYTTCSKLSIFQCSLENFICRTIGAISTARLCLIRSCSCPFYLMYTILFNFIIFLPFSTFDMRFIRITLWLLAQFSDAGQVVGDIKQLDNVCRIGQRDDFLQHRKPTFEQSPALCSHVHKPSHSDVHSPWTYKPRCMPKDSTNEIYCVFTNINFAGGRGISIFTSPKNAQSISRIAASTNTVPAGVNNFSDPPYEVRNIAGRGNGLFATRTLHRGDVIMAETPVGIYQSDAFPMDYELGYRYLNTAFKRLPKETQAKFMSMAAQNPGHDIMERVNTISFAGEFGGSAHFLVYPHTALMNHDCRPNAMYYYDPATLIHSTHASRTISPGEEITITYINMIQARKVRREHLHDLWGFWCDCSLCSKSQDSIAVSDNRIQQIIDLQANLADWSRQSNASPAMAESLMALYVEEDLHAAEATGHIFAAMSYNAAGDASKAQYFAARALESGMVNRGVDGGNNDVEDVRILLSNPKSHWTYMTRSHSPS
ncbi:hypothetical protein PVAG01_07387 [Phlyctema vagabunda]|uniref:SET domain-containing protein n=1 Tax=Phlyctema vagabunda TaxID=108571 RepID=A0ABR4PC81_9HELO